MSIYEEIEIEDMDFDEEKQSFFYPCPCGDKFVITLVGVGAKFSSFPKPFRCHRFAC